MKNYTPSKAPTVFTAGYSGITPDELAKAALALRAAVVDIRYSPRSRRPEWAKENLAQALRKRGVWYIHERRLGNVNFNSGGPIRLLDLDGAVERLRPILAERSVILLCVCADVVKCHRTPAAQGLAAATSREVVHLSREQIKAGRY